MSKTYIKYYPFKPKKLKPTEEARKTAVAEVKRLEEMYLPVLETLTQLTKKLVKENANLKLLDEIYTALGTEKRCIDANLQKITKLKTRYLELEKNYRQLAQALGLTLRKLDDVREEALQTVKTMKSSLIDIIQQTESELLEKHTSVARKLERVEEENKERHKVAMKAIGKLIDAMTIVKDELINMKEESQRLYGSLSLELRGVERRMKKNIEAVENASFERYSTLTDEQASLKQEVKKLKEDLEWMKSELNSLDSKISSLKYTLPTY